MPARDPPGMATVIEPVRAEDRAAMDGWFDLMTLCHAHDTPELPPPCPLGHSTRFSWPGSEHRAWVVSEGADVVGAAHMTLPRHDNLGHGFAHVLIGPRHRRRGLGSRLLDHVTTQARAAGRTRLALGADCPLDGSSPGAEFLRASGARLAMVEMRRRLDLPPADAQRLRDLTGTAREAGRGYRLVQWTGPTPAKWLDELAALIARMSTDAPMGDLTMEPQHWDADRVRERDAVAVRNGVLPVVTAAQAKDGHLVAFTEASSCVVRDGFASQGDTLVAPVHRGHRLGLWIKLANLELLLREHPEIRAIDTFNADENRWMIAVNELMGFRPLRAQGDWELAL